MKKKWKHQWPKVQVELPDVVFLEALRYWEELFKSNLKDPDCHPEDVKHNKKHLAACQTLIEFYK